MSPDTDAGRSRGLLADPLGSLGKVIGLAAGAGAFLYLIGVAVLWQRLGSAGLPEQEVLATIPRDQIAAAGIQEALLSAIAAALFGVGGFAGYQVFRLSERLATAAGPVGWAARGLAAHPVLALTAAMAALCLPLGPLSLIGLVFLGVTLVLVYFAARSAHRSLISESRDFHTSPTPWIRLAAALAAAVFIVSVVRQHEFPEELPVATITYVEGEGKPFEGAETCGLYLGTSSDSVILGLPTNQRFARRCGREPVERATTLVVARSTIASVALTEQDPPPQRAASLVARLGVLALECVSPVCRFDDESWSVLELFVPKDPEDGD